jgi:crotonobetainyl-CoA:carnitine CoA-transferase CaiB-like acyl-CoA transferase
VIRTLANLRVIEWGTGPIAAAYCTKLLAEFGARVDKVEPPGGDAARAHGPFPGDRPDAERSGLFAYLNAGKRSVVLDVDAVDDRATLQRLIEHADVFVTDVPLAVRRRLGLDTPTLRAAFPRLIVVSTTVFGDEGPYADAPAQAIDACAVSGTAWVIGEPGRPPLAIPLLQADWQAGANGAAATLMALLARRRDADPVSAASGEAIDVASADVLAAAAGTNGVIYLAHGLQRWVRAGRRAFASGGPYPYVILPCKDGAVCLIGRARQEWTRLVQAMGEPSWTTEPRYQDLQAMGRDYPDEVDALITPWLMQHTRAELLDLGERFGFPVGPLRTAREVVDTPQFAHRGFFRQVTLGDGSTLTVPGVPWPSTREPGVPPRLGAHTAEVRAELMQSEAG